MWSDYGRHEAVAPVQIAEQRDLVSMYLHEISRIPLLEAEDEVRLAKTIEAGLYAEWLLAHRPDPASPARRELVQIACDGHTAKEHFVSANLRLVVSIARRHASVGMPLSDLIQEGNISLIRAVEKFDYVRGIKFSTYATWWIKQAMGRCSAAQGRNVTLPVVVLEEVSRMQVIAHRLSHQLGYEPAPEQVAEVMGVKAARVTSLRRWAEKTISLDSPLNPESSLCLADVASDRHQLGPEELALNRMHDDELKDLLTQLDERSASIVRRRYGLADGEIHTVADVADHFGLSRERIRQLETRAIAKLRELAHVGA